MQVASFEQHRPPQHCCVPGSQQVEPQQSSKQQVSSAQRCCPSQQSSGAMHRPPGQHFLSPEQRDAHENPLRGLPLQRSQSSSQASALRLHVPPSHVPQLPQGSPSSRGVGRQVMSAVSQYWHVPHDDLSIAQNPLVQVPHWPHRVPFRTGVQTPRRHCTHERTSASAGRTPIAASTAPAAEPIAARISDRRELELATTRVS